MTPAADEYPFWGYEDLALFLGAVLPSVGLAVLVVRIAQLTNKAASTLVYQSLIYILLLPRGLVHSHRAALRSAVLALAPLDRRVPGRVAVRHWRPDSGDGQLGARGVAA